ncbi:ARM repeat-containing protein [Piromyces finnis]|uniref:ARM repeat-containing protein n=1 Tax=Piromyces finnis TaxID=1754191 RepID=A0A1Y1VNE9_9FUNG|nr:ARM repeat-containing protein [Piromyces finnis]|eukprot:ORX59900.1 ARM repeat-containing protein [Piromyces finnis]
MDYDYNRGRYRKRPYRHDRRDDSKQETVTQRLQRLILKIGDKINSNLQSDLESLAKVLNDEYNSHKDVILNTLKACITEIPTKTGVYATLTSLLNSNSYEFGVEIISTNCDAMDEALKHGKWTTVKLLMRYFASLINLNTITPYSFIGMIETFLGAIHEHDVRMERSDFFVYCVLSTLPWACEYLNEKASSELEKIYLAIEEYMNSRIQKMESLGRSPTLQSLQYYRDCDSPYEQVDYLESLWRQTIQLKAENWEVKVLPKTYKLFENISLMVVNGNLNQELRNFTLPPDSQDIKYMTPGTKFWIFDDSLINVENSNIHLPLTSSITRYILYDIAADTLNIFSINHKECTRFLLQYKDSFNSEYLDEINCNVYEAVMEVIFAEMLKLPSSDIKQIYYNTIVIDMCKGLMDKIPGVFGRTFRSLFNRFDLSEYGGLDVECIRRMTEFFSHHLSNFAYIWNWKDWIPILEKDPLSGQYVFIRETLEKCIRLSYYDRIKPLLPQEFTESDIFSKTAPCTNYKYQNNDFGDQTLYEYAQEIYNAFRSKTPPQEINVILEKINNYVSEKNKNNSMDVDEQELDPESIVLEIVIQSAMMVGSKSFSHILNVVERYISILTSLNATNEAKDKTVRFVADFWKYNPQFLEIILDKLVNYRVVDPSNIISWILSDIILSDQYTNLYVWSILRNTLKKVVLRVQQIKAKLEYTKMSYKEQEEKSMLDDKESIETMRNSHEEAIAVIEKTQEAVIRDQKEAFICVFQRFVDTTEIKIKEFERQNIDPVKTPWWRWVVGFIRDVGRTFSEEVQSFMVTLETIILTDNLDPRIKNVWNEIHDVYERAAN